MRQNIRPFWICLCWSVFQEVVENSQRVGRQFYLYDFSLISYIIILNIFKKAHFILQNYLCSIMLKQMCFYVFSDLRFHDQFGGNDDINHGPSHHIP